MMVDISRTQSPLATPPARLVIVAGSPLGLRGGGCGGQRQRFMIDSSVHVVLTPSPASSQSSSRRRTVSSQRLCCFSIEAKDPASTLLGEEAEVILGPGFFRYYREKRKSFSAHPLVRSSFYRPGGSRGKVVADEATVEHRIARRRQSVCVAFR